MDRDDVASRLNSETMTIAEVAAELRCSKTHVCNLINGKVRGVPQLPALILGRRKLVRRTRLRTWMCAVEEGHDTLASPETAAGRMAEGAYHA